MKRVWGERWGLIPLVIVLVAALVAAIRPVPPGLVPYTSPPITLGKETFQVRMLVPVDWEMDVDALAHGDVLLHARPVHRPPWWLPLVGSVEHHDHGEHSVDVWLSAEEVVPEKVVTSSTSGGGSPSTHCSRQIGRIGASVFCRGTGGGYYDEQIGREICQSVRVTD